jgi:hypothetical protein
MVADCAHGISVGGLHLCLSKWGAVKIVVLFVPKTSS